MELVMGILSDRPTIQRGVCLVFLCLHLKTPFAHIEDSCQSLPREGLPILGRR
jgi:hypothetical protein